MCIIYSLRNNEFWGPLLMKDQINRLARGEFIYETPTLTISEANIEKSIDVGITYLHAFKVTGSSEIKGVVYSTDYRVTVNSSNFIGVENIIQYTVDTVGILANEIIKGSFNIVSNAGEKSIPYAFKAVENTIETSMGKVHNVFHFANIAQMAPEEAQSIYLSENFSKVFLKKDLNLLNIYATLCKGENTRQNIEEFLIAISKKTCITLSLSKDKMIYRELTENYQDTITIQKSTWGYIEFSVETDADFITIVADKCKMDSDVFAGNKFNLPYILDKDRMHPGKNFGRIIITSAHQKLVYEIETENYSIGITDRKSGKITTKSKDKKRAMYELTKKYMEFRTKELDLRGWIENSNHILNRIRGILSEDVFFKIAQAQIWNAQNKDEDSQWLLESIKDDILQNKETDILLYCYYLYVNSIVKKDPEYTAEILKIIKKYYENGYDEWQLLWIMFYLDDEYDKNKSIKLARIKEQFHRGCKSPILYLEACNIINAYPMLLRVLNEFELQVINFACKNNLINEKMAEQICEVCKTEKSVSKTYLRILKKVYDRYENDEMLNVLCTNLIRNELNGPEFFDIYEKSIIKNFRITKLYEYYMDSIDESKLQLLPKMVLLYFAYNNQLEYDKKAFLYASIINNKEKDRETYYSYSKQIELFGIDQIRRGRISENLMVVYKDIWDGSLINEETATTVSKILFSYKLTCKNSDMKYVIVKHKEINSEIIIPLENNIAYIQMYTENCSIIFESSSKERRKDGISYELKRLFEDTSFALKVYDINNYDLYLSMYFCERSYKYQKRTGDTFKIQNFLLGSYDVTPEFKEKLRHTIINYYYHDYIGDEFKQRFFDINTEGLTENEASMLIEICVIHGMYEDAYDLSILYGYRKVNPKRLFKLCRRMVEITNYTYNELLVGMCKEAVSNKKYDDCILEYLISNFNGSANEMYEICESCYSFNVEAYEIEERFIAQMLFSNTTNEHLDYIFDKYFERGAKERIVSAYLAFNAYNYFVKKMKISQTVFKTLEEIMYYDVEECPLSSKIAMLKYYSTLEKLDENQTSLAKQLLDELCRNNKIFGFYKELGEKVQLPYIIMDKTVVEYRTNPNNKVVINYMLSDKDKKDTNDKSMQYVKETMKNTFEGVFTKEFTLLYGDVLEFYFTEIANGIETSSDNKKIVCNNINPSTTNGRFEHINDMLASKELHDMATLKKLMHGYCVQDYVTQQLFRPF